MTLSQQCWTQTRIAETSTSLIQHRARLRHTSKLARLSVCAGPSSGPLGANHGCECLRPLAIALPVHGLLPGHAHNTPHTVRCVEIQARHSARQQRLSGWPLLRAGLPVRTHRPQRQSQSTVCMTNQPQHPTPTPTKRGGSTSRMSTSNDLPPSAPSTDRAGGMGMSSVGFKDRVLPDTGVVMASAWTGCRRSWTAMQRNPGGVWGAGHRAAWTRRVGSVLHGPGRSG